MRLMVIVVLRPFIGQFSQLIYVLKSISIEHTLSERVKLTTAKPHFRSLAVVD